MIEEESLLQTDLSFLKDENGIDTKIDSEQKSNEVNKENKSLPQKDIFSLNNENKVNAQNERETPVNEQASSHVKEQTSVEVHSESTRVKVPPKEIQTITNEKEEITGVNATPSSES